MTVDRQQFRDALRRWASGVTIVTTRVGDRDLGMTVSAFSSVSLDPPLVLVCADSRAHTHAGIAQSGVFAVNVLAAGQEALSSRFATEGNEEIRFDGLACRRAGSGAAWLPGIVAALDCRVVAAHPAGDHVLYVGAVERAEVDLGAEPLVYYDAHYRDLAPRSS